MRKATRIEMARVFDRPTPWTLNSMYVVDATEAKLEARVDFKAKFKQQSTSPLRPHVFSGDRAKRNIEQTTFGSYYLPTDNVKLDAYGNVPGNTMKQIKNALAGKGKKASEIWLGTRNGGTGRYVWKRTAPIGKQGSKRGIQALLIMSNKATYKKRLDVNQISQDYISTNFARNIAEAWTATGYTAA